MKSLLLALLLLGSALAQAQSETSAAPKTPPSPPASGDPQKPAAAPAPPKPAEPAAEREFKPTEEVSPDTEVDFPADL